MKHSDVLETIDNFGRTHGIHHVSLAMHASLSNILLPDLVNLIRINFVPDADPIAEVDLLLSQLCFESQGHYYEMYPRARTYLRDALIEEPSFGAKYSRELYVFLYEYARIKLRDSDLTSQAVREALTALRWIALSEVSPQAASGALATEIKKSLTFGNQSAALRVAKLASTLAEPLITEEKVLLYASALGKKIEGEDQDAKEIFDLIENKNKSVVVHGMELPSLAQAAESLRLASSEAFFRETTQTTYENVSANEKVIDISRPTNESNRFVPQIRVFLASPGDVNEERAVALQVLDMLEYDPIFRKDGVPGASVHAVAWDKPGGAVPMRAAMVPQAAINQGLPRPSECDIVLVFFWSRMGTPLPHPEYQKEDGTPYLSGTEWEFHDAMNAERQNGKPITILYRRTEKPVIDLENDAALDQYRRVQDFFNQFRDPVSGALTVGFNEYTNPEDLRLKLVNHLRAVINDLLSVDEISRVASAAAPAVWNDSPYPGLRSFTEQDAPIFFGRGEETTRLVRMVKEVRFVAVVGASGSGKSSLVAAGLIPRLKANAISSENTGSTDWRFARFTPGQYDNPIEGLFHSLTRAFPERKVSPFMIRQELESFITSINQNPNALVAICDALIDEAQAPEWSEIMFFIDQFEELFTLVSEQDRRIFVDVLDVINQSQRLRCIITLRSDFYANCIEHPALANILRSGSYPLSVPSMVAMHEMIVRPAERANLQIEEDLAERILNDTGNEPGNLALMAYALGELYKLSEEDSVLSHADYDALGGVQGAISQRAEYVYTALPFEDTLKDELLRGVFLSLVEVDLRGTATRRRANLSDVYRTEHGGQFVSAFVDARLLVASRPEDSETVVEIAHEAIFRSWSRLADWINEIQDDLRLIQTLRSDAAAWENQGRPEYLRYNQERVNITFEAITRLRVVLPDIVREFIEPESDRLLRELDSTNTTHARRRDIGDRLAVGDPRHGIGVKNGMVDIEWLTVEGSTSSVKFDFGDFKISQFYISKYPITYAQFQLFIDSDYDNPNWWQGFPEQFQPEPLRAARTTMMNAPRDTVSWYQCVAFSRWLNEQLQRSNLLPKGSLQVRLPTEWEWQWATQNGSESRSYPWGEWHASFTNTAESGLSRSTAVGVYPHGAAPCGALDMSGNVWEWCLNSSEKPSDFSISSSDRRVIRGGSYLATRQSAQMGYRDGVSVNEARADIGFRLVAAQPLSL